MSLESLPPGYHVEAPAPKDLVFYKYEKKRGKYMVTVQNWEGKKGTKPGYYFPIYEGSHWGFKALNLYADEQVPIPPKAKRSRRPSLDWIRKYMSDPTRTHAAPLRVRPKGELYYTHDNGGRPFAVYIDETTVSVYSQVDPAYFVWDHVFEDAAKSKSEWRWYFSLAYQAKNVRNIWVGKSNPKHNCHPKGDWSTGNSILVQVSAHKYVFIGDTIYSFISREQVTEYYSPVGNNDVPYPVAETATKYLFMLDHVWRTKKGFIVTQQQHGDLYYHFYGHHTFDRAGNRLYPAHTGKSGKFQGVKVIRERE